jgi:hypothetical protein
MGRPSLQNAAIPKRVNSDSLMRVVSTMMTYKVIKENENQRFFNLQLSFIIDKNKQETI